jgi:hypothetical protein
MSSDNAYRREVEKRLLDLEKIAKEIFEHIELLKMLLADQPSPKNSETISTEVPKETDETAPPSCLHYFGYLRFVPRNKSIPEECLACQKAIECSKHTD